MELLRRIFPTPKRVICPYDLTDIRYKNRPDRCPECDSELERLYVERFVNIPPFFVQMIGWSGVGKTVYLQALTLMLQRMNSVWHYFASTPLTEPTRQFKEEVLAFINTNKMPQTTQLGIQDAFIVHLQDMERWGNRTLVLRDVAGEYFQDTLKFPIEYTPYLLNVPVTFMMVSLPDLKDAKTKGMDDLMTSFILTMTNADVDFNKEFRRVIVVLSKADLLTQSELPQELQVYLEDDPLKILSNSEAQMTAWSARQMEDYIQSLRVNSQIIQRWLSDTNAEARNLIGQARVNNIHLEFAIVSSTGTDDTHGQQLRPVRVVDPFFWALDFQSRPSN